ncbi:hypothetical protein O181_064927 [Austropuccinia psidii MF-1]|uniref:Zn(2)-C6 fungal-type domain-containing protein n=1 Tax=Austropuccinia psidii MF-1 TaxID=1389203 RepID=A0A9Q3EWK7_9BASI|nr:hypothetical protein [Austropuccinia psidii MF-1]
MPFTLFLTRSTSFNLTRICPSCAYSPWSSCISTFVFRTPLNPIPFLVPMLCTLCTKRGIPCIHSLTTTNACDACRQVHKKCLFIVCPFRPQGQRSSCPRHPCKDSFVVNNDETISKRKWTLGPQAGQRERFRMISPVPSSINLSTPPPRPPSDGHFTPQPEQSDYPADEGWQWQEDIRAWADRHHVLSPMAFKRQKQNPPNPPNKTLPFLVCLASKPRGNPLQARVAPDGLRNYSAVKSSQTKEPPIPGPSPLSQPPEDNTTCEPEPEVAPTQSMEEPFARPATPRSIIIIDDTPVGSPPPPPPSSYPTCPPSPSVPPLHSNPGSLPVPREPRCKAPLICTMTLTRNSPIYDQL